MNHYTLSQLKPILREGDWLIPKGKSVAMQVNWICNLDDDRKYAIELRENWCESFPRFSIQDSQEFAYVPKAHMEAITSGSIVMHKSSAKLEVPLHP